MVTYTTVSQLFLDLKIAIIEGNFLPITNLQTKKKMATFGKCVIYSKYDMFQRQSIMWF